MIFQSGVQQGEGRLQNYEMGQKNWQKNNDENSCLTCLLNPDFGYP